MTKEKVVTGVNLGVAEGDDGFYAYMEDQDGDLIMSSLPCSEARAQEICDEWIAKSLVVFKDNIASSTDFRSAQ